MANGEEQSPEGRIPQWDARPLTEMFVHFADQWRVILPRVYRYLESRYIDEFFENGRLRLSSFKRFSEHADEQRKDKEGWTINSGVFKGDGDDDGATVFVVSGSGHNGYVLCGSVLESKDLMDAFDVDACFVIEDTLGFANAVKRHIPGCGGGIQGLCVYSPHGRVIHRPLDVDPRELMNQAKRDDGTLDMALLPTLNQMVTGTEQLLIKAQQFQHQAEYRFIWATVGDADGYLDIVCPEAVQFCRRVA